MLCEGGVAMARRLFRQYTDIPDGTECHRKTYASTSIGAAVGERQPAPSRRPQGGHRVPGGLPGQVMDAGNLAGWSLGCPRATVASLV